VDLTVVPYVLFPSWPRVVPLIMNHGKGGIKKLRGTLRYFERLVTHHQLVLGGNLEPSEATLDVPPKSLFQVALGLWPPCDATEALGGTIETRLAGAPRGVTRSGHNVPVLMRERVDKTAALSGIDADEAGGI
jgi:hypothetical protein